MNTRICSRCGSDVTPLTRSRRSGGVKWVCINEPACRRRRKRIELRQRRRL